MNKKVTFVELVELMAEASSTSKRVCELFLRELFSTISQALINGESVKVNGVGTFKLTQVKPRKSSKEKSDDSLTSGGSSKVSFTPDVPQNMLGGMTAGLTFRYNCEKYF